MSTQSSSPICLYGTRPAFQEKCVLCWKVGRTWRIRMKHRCATIVCAEFHRHPDGARVTLRVIFYSNLGWKVLCALRVSRALPEKSCGLLACVLFEFGCFVVAVVVVVVVAVTVGCVIIVCWSCSTMSYYGAGANESTTGHSNEKTWGERISDYFVNDGLKTVWILLWVAGNFAVGFERFYRKWSCRIHHFTRSSFTPPRLLLGVETRSFWHAWARSNNSA